MKVGRGCIECRAGYLYSRYSGYSLERIGQPDTKRLFQSSIGMPCELGVPLPYASDRAPAPQVSPVPAINVADTRST